MMIVLRQFQISIWFYKRVNDSLYKKRFLDKDEGIFLVNLK